MSPKADKQQPAAKAAVGGNNNKKSAPSPAAAATSSSTSAAAAATQAPASPVAPFKIPRASPIANYTDDGLSERQTFLLNKMSKMKLYRPKALPAPRLNRDRGWLKILNEKYNIETALYMLEPWERVLLNTLLVGFILLLAVWTRMLFVASAEAMRDHVVPAFIVVAKMLTGAKSAPAP